MVKYFSWCKLSLCIVCCGLLVGCHSSVMAPVEDGWKQPGAASRYRVQSGDTLYSIAWAFGMDYRDLARANGLRSPGYAIVPGQLLAMKVTKRPKRAEPVYVRPKMQQVTVARSHAVVKPLRSPRLVLKKPTRWLWPMKGRVIKPFSGQYGGNLGIDISGYSGEMVRATAPGVVVYSGTGVRGYGNLVIIKHSEDFLSAYAYASRRLVRQGAVVKAGQKIAQMRRDPAGRSRLHFELRRNGRPVDPLRYLR